MAKFVVAIPLHLGKKAEYKLVSGEVNPFGCAMMGAVLDVDPEAYAKAITNKALVPLSDAKKDPEPPVPVSQEAPKDKTVRRTFGKKGDA